MIRVATSVWTDTLSHFRRCGSGRRECVMYWTGPVAAPDVVDGAVHPRHAASAGSYELDERWLHEFWVGLPQSNRCVRVQVHTHGFSAFHSETDDRWPIVHVPGFLSLVVPNFAMQFSKTGLFLAKIDANGEWTQVALDDHLSEIP